MHAPSLFNLAAINPRSYHTWWMHANGEQGSTLPVACWRFQSQASSSYEFCMPCTWTLEPATNIGNLILQKATNREPLKSTQHKLACRSSAIGSNTFIVENGE